MPPQFTGTKGAEARGLVGAPVQDDARGSDVRVLPGAQQKQGHALQDTVQRYPGPRRELRDPIQAGELLHPLAQRGLGGTRQSALLRQRVHDKIPDEGRGSVKPGLKCADDAEKEEPAATRRGRKSDLDGHPGRPSGAGAPVYLSSVMRLISLVCS